MKKLLLLLALASILALTACGQSAEKLNNEGNEAYQNQDYETALAAYQQAQSDNPELAEPHYNAANVHYRQGAYDQVQQEIEQSLVKEDAGLTENSFFNLGNGFFQQENYEAAVNAYSEALRLSPDDLEAKQNLELALQRQQEQQQDQQQQQQDQQQDQQQNNDQQENNDQQQDNQQQDQQQDQQQNSDQQQDGQQDKQQQDNQQQDGQQGDQPDQQQDNQQDEQQQGNQQQDSQQGDQPEQQQDDQQNEQQRDNQQQDGQQDDQRQDNQQPDNQQNDQRQDQQQDGQAGGGQPQDQQQPGQPNGQPQQVRALTQEQARQLFEAATQGTESLEEHLQQILVVPGGPPLEDW